METKVEAVKIVFIRLKEVMAICGMSRSAIYGAIKKGQFPAQVKLYGRSSAWLHSEVTAWGESRVQAARGGPAAKGAGGAAETSVA
jgi:prophage regulatory protein